MTLLKTSPSTRRRPSPAISSDIHGAYRVESTPDGRDVRLHRGDQQKMRVLQEGDGLRVWMGADYLEVRSRVGFVTHLFGKKLDRDISIICQSDDDDPERVIVGLSSDSEKKQTQNRQCAVRWNDPKAIMYALHHALQRLAPPEKRVEIRRAIMLLSLERKEGILHVLMNEADRSLSLSEPKTEAPPRQNGRLTREETVTRRNMERRILEKLCGEERITRAQLCELLNAFPRFTYVTPVMVINDTKKRGSGNGMERLFIPSNTVPDEEDLERRRSTMLAILDASEKPMTRRDLLSAMHDRGFNLSKSTVLNDTTLYKAIRDHKNLAIEKKTFPACETLKYARAVQVQIQHILEHATQPMTQKDILAELHRISGFEKVPRAAVKWVTRPDSPLRVHSYLRILPTRQKIGEMRRRKILELITAGVLQQPVKPRDILDVLRLLPPFQKVTYAQIRNDLQDTRFDSYRGEGHVQPQSAQEA